LNDETRPPDQPQTTEPAGASPGPAGSFLRRYGALFKHWALFLGIFGALLGIYEWKVHWVNLYFSEFTAQFMAVILSLLGHEGQASGVLVSCSLCRFRIIGECTAYYPLSIFVAAVLAFPTAWSRRILGVVLGVPVMLLINQVRLVSLCYIYKPYNDIFETIHIVVWQSLIIFLTVVLWILWATTLGRRP
jgi:archaeosortase B (VPXXXP-CTERM-specific)